MNRANNDRTIAKRLLALLLVVTLSFSSFLFSVAYATDDNSNSRTESDGTLESTTSKQLSSIAMLTQRVRRNL